MKGRSISKDQDAQAPQTKGPARPEVSATQVKEKIEAALKRQATADGKAIHIETSGGKVTLTGHASSWHSIADATNAAWGAPGATDVVDN